jgi:hypothetical protein
MEMYLMNLKKVETAFINKIGYSIFIRETAIEILEKYPDAKTQRITKIHIGDGLLTTTLHFN